MKPARRPRAPRVTETAEHRTIASWLRKVGLSGCAKAFHVRNERPGDWQRLNAAKMGILVGCPDWMIVDSGRAGFIELKPRGWKAEKARTGNYDSHEIRQLETQADLKRAGAWVEVVESLDEFVAALVFHGVPVRSSDVVTESLRLHLPAAMAAAACPIPGLAEMPDDDLDRAIDEAAL